jgi:hypothetical protein
MTIENIKDLRVKLSIIYNTMRLNADGRYGSLALTTLEEGRMWLGDMLGHMGAAYPYTGSGKDAAADYTDELLPASTSTSEAIILIRRELNPSVEILAAWYPMLGHIKDLPLKGSPAMFRLKMAMRNAYTGIKLSRMWMGMRLAELEARQPKGNADVKA